MINPKFYIVVFGICLLLSACTTVPNGGIPSYIQIDSIQLATSADSQGSSSIMTPICWIEAGGQNLGGWQLPAKIPFLQTGQTTIRIFPGVYNNAIAEYAPYPFFNFYEVTTNLIQKEVVLIKPMVTYKPNIKFCFEESFEKSIVFDEFVKTEHATNDIKGKYYGKLSLQAAAEKKCISTKTITVRAGVQSYLEFDYCSDEPGSVFFVNSYYPGQTDDIDVLIQLTASSKNWKRAYIPIAEDIGRRGTVPFNLMFTLIKKDEQSTASINIDNIKIISY